MKRNSRRLLIFKSLCMIIWMFSLNVEAMEEGICTSSLDTSPRNQNNIAQSELERADVAFLRKDATGHLLEFYNGGALVAVHKFSHDPGKFIDFLSQGIDGNFYVVLGGRMGGRLVQIHSMNELHDLPLKGLTQIYDVQCGIDGRVYVIGAESFESDNLRLVMINPGSDKPEYRDISKHYRQAFTRTPDGMLYLDAGWHSQDLETLVMPNTPGSPIKHLSLNKTGKYLIHSNGRVDMLEHHNGSTFLKRLDPQRQEENQKIELPFKEAFDLHVDSDGSTYVIGTHPDEKKLALTQVGMNKVENTWEIPLNNSRELVENFSFKSLEQGGTIYLESNSGMMGPETLIRVSPHKSSTGVMTFQQDFQNSNGRALRVLKNGALYYVQSENEMWVLKHDSQTPERIPLAIEESDSILEIDVADNGTLYIIARHPTDEMEAPNYGMIRTSDGKTQRISGVSHWEHAVVNHSFALSSLLTYQVSAAEQYRQVGNLPRFHRDFQRVLDLARAWVPRVSIQDGEAFFQFLDKYWQDEDEKISSKISDLLNTVISEKNHSLKPYALGFWIEHQIPHVFLKHQEFGRFDVKAIKDAQDYTQKLERTQWACESLRSLQKMTPDWYQSRDFSVHYQHIKLALDALGEGCALYSR